MNNGFVKIPVMLWEDIYDELQVAALFPNLTRQLSREELLSRVDDYLDYLDQYGEVT